MGKFSIILLFVLVLGGVFSASAQSTRFEGAGALLNDPQPKVQLYPNPAVDFVSVKIEGVDHKQVKVTLHNIIGNPITVDVDAEQDEIRIKVKDLPAGYYLLALRSDELMFKGTYKFLKR